MNKILKILGALALVFLGLKYGVPSDDEDEKTKESKENTISSEEDSIKKLKKELSENYGYIYDTQQELKDIRFNQWYAKETIENPGRYTRDSDIEKARRDLEFYNKAEEKKEEELSKLEEKNKEVWGKLYPGTEYEDNRFKN